MERALRQLDNFESHLTTWYRILGSQVPAAPGNYDPIASRRFKAVFDTVHYRGHAHRYLLGAMTDSLSHRLSSERSSAINSVLQSLSSIPFGNYNATIPTADELESLSAQFLAVFQTIPSRFLA